MTAAAIATFVVVILVCIVGGVIVVGLGLQLAKDQYSALMGMYLFLGGVVMILAAIWLIVYASNGGFA